LGWVNSLNLFFSSSIGKYNVVDCGCGDFNIGSQIRSIFNKYVACDIVEDLIKFNQKKFIELNVDFKFLNVINDELPHGDILIFRQVLQHLSNDNILKIVSKIKNNYRYIIITEHLPTSYDFIPNLNKTNGPGIRLNKNSGVILSEHPFNLIFLEKFVISDIPQDNGRIETIVYKIF
jgi:2-polyprenyl-3-methyl-5-hydroxy-6-metoxy-1,4-benzoquinol methylase